MFPTICLTIMSLQIYIKHIRTIIKTIIKTIIYHNWPYGCFHKWGYPIAGWFIREHPNLKWMITRGTPFQETSTSDPELQALPISPGPAKTCWSSCTAVTQRWSESARCSRRRRFSWYGAPAKVAIQKMEGMYTINPWRNPWTIPVNGSKAHEKMLVSLWKLWEICGKSMI